MPRASLSDLQIKLELAKEKINVGNTYIHYKDKNKENIYTVTDIVFLEEDEDLLVVYSHNECITWARRLSDFTADVEIDGITVKRFELIKN